MTTRTKHVAILLTAAVVLSLGAYALGSQAGGGGALASDSSSAATGAGGSASPAGFQRTNGDRVHGLPRRGDFFGLDALASRLGVSTTALRDALQAIRSSQTPQQRRRQLVQALATALSLPVDKVTSALGSVLPDGGDRKAAFAAALAKDLGVDTARVQAAFDKLRADLHNRWRDEDRNGPSGDRRAALADALARELGVDAAKVRAALAKLRHARGDRRGPGRRADLRQRLATALGVTEAQLERALDKVRTDARDAFATALAQRLNIDVQKVKDALADFSRGARRHG